MTDSNREPAGPPGRAVRAGSDQPARLGFGIDRVAAGAERGTVPVTTRDLLATPFFTLVEFARADAAATGDILLVPPLSGHFPVLLRDMVLGLLARFRVHMIDWANVRHTPLVHGSFGLDDNIAAVMRAIGALPPGLAVAGLCQGGIPALAATALLAAAEDRRQPAALVLVASPVDPLANPTTVVRLIRAAPPPWPLAPIFARVGAPHAGRGRLVYPAAVQAAMLRLHLRRRLAERGELWLKLGADDGADPARFAFADLYGAVMDLDARVFAEILGAVFHDRAILAGRLACAGRLVEPAAIARTALMTVEGEADVIAAPGQTRAAHALCPAVPASRRRAILVAGAGHFSLIHGAIWRRAVLPEIEAFCLPGRAEAPRRAR